MFVVRLSGTIVNKSQTLKLESSPSKARAKWFETLKRYGIICSVKTILNGPLVNYYCATYKAVDHGPWYTVIDLRTPVFVLGLKFHSRPFLAFETSTFTSVREDSNSTSQVWSETLIEPNYDTSMYLTLILVP